MLHRTWRKLAARARGWLAMPVALQRLAWRVEDLQQALGRIELRQLYGQQPTPTTPREAELKVFSQAGEDGVIQFILRHVPIARPIFVEFGVEDYAEANTRFLLRHGGWSGLVIDGSPRHIEAIRRDRIYWQHNLKAELAFVDRETIDEVLLRYGVSGDIGLLSIDIDGNDYWVWEAIAAISPRIVICEYNSLWGCERPVSIPYERAFARTAAHFSNNYFGASVRALAHLGGQKGYTLVGSNALGTNLFFVRADLAGGLAALTPEAAYVASPVRQSRDAEGRLTFLDSAAALRLIADLPLVDVVTGERLRVGDLAAG